MWKTLLCLALLHTAAFAQTLRPGVYRGPDDHRLFLQELPGRDGSFLGLIVKDGRQAVPYLVDEFATGRYGLIPLYNQRNLIGASNYTPSLTASVVSERNGLRVNVAPNPGNNTGFNLALAFTSTNERTPWLASQPGNYTYSSVTGSGNRRRSTTHRRAATLGPQDRARESQLTITDGDLAGSYILREVRPGMHLAFRSNLSTTGVEVVEESRWVVVFLRGCLGWSSKMVFIDTSNWNLRDFTLN